MLFKSDKDVRDYDQGNNANLWTQIKRLARTGNTEEVLKELDTIKVAKILDDQEYSCLLNVALTASIGEKHKDTSLALLRYGADPAPYEGLALRLAASLNQEELVLECIKKGADPTIGGNMILDLAIANNQLKAIKTLLTSFKNNPQRPSPKELINSSTKAYQNSTPNISKDILDILSTKELQKELKEGDINGNPHYIPKEIQDLAKKIITTRRKKSLGQIIESEALMV